MNYSEQKLNCEINQMTDCLADKDVWDTHASWYQSLQYIFKNHTLCWNWRPGSKLTVEQRVFNQSLWPSYELKTVANVSTTRIMTQPMQQYTSLNKPVYRFSVLIYIKIEFILEYLKWLTTFGSTFGRGKKKLFSHFFSEFLDKLTNKNMKFHKRLIEGFAARK